ncbi:MAG: hypothetical protein LC749_04290 [Actinobacteria bacterium]|nr:hypothetical protein [Actinomycetota bacterium]
MSTHAEPTAPAGAGTSSPKSIPGTAAEHFTYGELEENDEDLTKLRRWLAKIIERDVLGAGGAPAALDACASALDTFAHRVYNADTDA